MELDWGFAESGFVRPAMQEIKDYLISSYLIKLPSADFSPGGMLDIAVTAEAEVKAKQYADLERAIEEGYLDSSNGIFVDRNVKPLGKTRKQPTLASSKVEFKGKKGKHIPRGLKLTTPNGLIFITIGEGEIGPDGVIVKVSAEQVGSIYNVSTGAINSLMSLDTDIESVTNIIPATGGMDREKDYELKERVYDGFIKSENRPVDIINSEIKAIDGVISSIVLENKKDMPDGVLGPHSLMAVVDGGDDDRIFDVLFNYIPFGVQTKATTDINIVSKVVSDGPNIYDLKFFRPTMVNFTVKVEILGNTALTEVEKEQVEGLVLEVYSDIKIYEDVVPREIFKRLSDVINYNSVKVLLSKDGIDWVDYIEIAPTEKGEIGEVIVDG